MLQVNALHTHYAKSHILHGVNLTVEAGEIVCLLGRNGVGKSTTLKSLMGLVKPSAGSVMCWPHILWFGARTEIR